MKNCNGYISWPIPFPRPKNRSMSPEDLAISKRQTIEIIISTNACSSLLQIFIQGSRGDLSPRWRLKSFRIHEPWKYWPSSLHFLHENQPIFRPRSRIRVSWLMIMKLLITTGLVKARWNTRNTRGELPRRLLISNRECIYTRMIH